MLTLFVIELLAQRWEPAQLFVVAYVRRGPTTKLLCLLMLMVAAIHIGLIPAHWRVDPIRCVAFAGESVALAGLTLWAITGSGWQPATAGIMIANLFGYWYYVANGLEAFEAIGLVSKFVEAACLGLLGVTSLDFIRAVFGRARLRLTAGA